MVDRGIIFSAPMVQALLDGRKTQTRRLATSPLRRCEPGDRLWVREAIAAEELSRPPRSVALNAKDRRLSGRTRAVVCDELDGADGIRYLADDAWVIIDNTPEAGDAWFNLFHYHCKDGERPSGHRGKSVPSIHMPRWASRLTLIVTEVRTQSLNDISEEDALAEGIVWDPEQETFWVPGVKHPNPDFPYLGRATARGMYAALWDTLHGSGEWLGNPEVVAVTYAVARANIDQTRRCYLCAGKCRGHQPFGSEPGGWEPEPGSQAAIEKQEEEAHGR